MGGQRRVLIRLAVVCLFRAFYREGTGSSLFLSQILFLAAFARSNKGGFARAITV